MGRFEHMLMTVCIRCDPITTGCYYVNSTVPAVSGYWVAMYTGGSYSLQLSVITTYICLSLCMYVYKCMYVPSIRRTSEENKRKSIHGLVAENDLKRAARSNRANLCFRDNNTYNAKAEVCSICSGSPFWIVFGH
jgi:hypothetical protein